MTVCEVSGHLSMFLTSFAFVNNCIQNRLVPCSGFYLMVNGDGAK